MHLSSAEKYAPATTKHRRKSLIFFNEEKCTNKETKSTYDVTMGSFEGAKRRHLVAFYTQFLRAKLINKEKFAEETGMKE